MNTFPPSASTSSSRAAAGIAGLDSRVARELLGDPDPHSLKSPGSYEWWYFNALSPQGDGITCALFHGLPFHPNYLTKLHRESILKPISPKETPAHLSADHYPAAYCALYKAGKKVAQFLNVYPHQNNPGDSPDIRIGPNRITVRQDGSLGITIKGYPFEIVRGQPRRRPNQVLSAQLTFSPTFSSPPHTREFRTPSAGGATHHWVLAAPHGQVTGTAQVVDSKNEVELFELPIDSIGYHDHVYGHGTLADGIHKQIWGYLQGDTWTAVWHQTISAKQTAAHANGLLFFQKGRKPVIVDAPEAKEDRFQIGRWLVRHPGRIAMHGSDTSGHPVECLITHPSILDTAPFHTRLAATGSITIPGRGSFQGSGTTHLLQLRRLKWPILSDVTLQAITMVARDDPLWHS